jgi:hypothetical protein
LDEAASGRPKPVAFRVVSGYTSERKEFVRYDPITKTNAGGVATS